MNTSKDQNCYQGCHKTKYFVLNLNFKCFVFTKSMFFFND